MGFMGRLRGAEEPQEVQEMNDKTRSMLTELADFLDTLPRGRFDYSVWIGEDWKGVPDLSCGTAACAGGWATTLPSFQAAGLFLEVSTVGSTVAKHGGPDGIYWGLDALTEVLGIDYEDAALLFLPNRAYRGLVAPNDSAAPSEVAAHIRRWLDVAS